MLARHVMLAWYMFSFSTGSGPVLIKKLYFCDFPGGGGGGGGGGGPDPLPPPLDPDPLMIRLLPSAI